MIEQHYLFNNITSIIFAISVIVMFVIYCHVLVKQHKRPLGELLTWQAIKHNESIFVMMMIAACVAEGLSAATVIAPGLIPANPLARVTSHLFVSFAGIIGALTLFKDAAQILLPGSDGLSKFFQFLVVVFIVILAFGSPLLNLYLMAGNLKQELELQLYFFQVAPWTTYDEWSQVATFYDKDPQWSAWAALEPNLKVSVGITFLHFMIAGLEGARSMSTANRRKQLFEIYEEKKEEKKEVDKRPKDEEQDDDGMKRNLHTMLAFYGYTGDELKKFVSDGYNVLYSITDTGIQGKMGVRTAQLAKEVEALGKRSLSSSEKEKLERELKIKIRELFGASKRLTGSDGKPVDAKKLGLGITLRAVK